MMLHNSLRFRFSIAAFVFLALVVLLGFSAVADSPNPQESTVGQQMEFDADTIQMDIAVQEDGSAEWTVSFWLELADSESQEAFESIQEDIEADPESQTQQFADRIEQTVATATDATGREMAVSQFTVSAERQSLAREFGVIRYSFHWSEFAERDDEHLQVGDAITGLFLDDDTRLLISWPEAYELESVTPEPSEQRTNAVIWTGSETAFASDEPRVVLVSERSGLSVGLILGGVGGSVLLLSLLGWWVWRQRVSSESTTDTPERSSADNQSPTGSNQRVSASSGPKSTDYQVEPDQSLLSNEEQVMRLLEANGRRIKQKRVVDELEWTDAKTSKVVSTLRDENKIESFRIGRENVLTLPEDEEHSELDR